MIGRARSESCLARLVGVRVIGAQFASSELGMRMRLLPSRFPHELS